MGKKSSRVAATFDKAAAGTAHALEGVAGVIETLPERRAEAAAGLDHVRHVARDVASDLSSVPGDLKRAAGKMVKAAKRARKALSSKVRAKVAAAARKRAKAKNKSKSRKRKATKRR